MKQKLAAIYRELSSGKLSAQAAMARIRSLNQPGRHSALDTLFAAPAWERCPLPAGETAECAQHHVLLCDLPKIAAVNLEALLPRSRCETATTHANDVAKDYATIALEYFETMQRILRAKPDGRSLVQLVVAERDGSQLFAGLQGLIETAALENPQIVGQIVFVPFDIAIADLAQRLQAERDHSRESVVRFAGNARLSRRWRRIDTASIAADVPCAFKEQGVYLITGGLGGLGLLLAKEILNRTSRAKVILTGRTAAMDTKLAALESLRQTGRVDYRQVDVAEADAVDQLVSSIVNECGQLNGIIHSAGLLHDAFMLKKFAAQFSDVLQPKVAGTANLDVASAAIELDFFVLFSSIASWAGNIGQSDYAAANGFMDQFAGYRNALVAAGKRKGKTLAIAWPHWVDGGMRIDTMSKAQLEQRTGLRSLETEQGMDALHRCLTLSNDAVMVMRGSTADMCRALDAERAIGPSMSPTKQEAPTRTTDLVGATREILRKELSPVLKVPVHKIETGVELANYGIDSIVAMNLTNRLELTFGALPKTLFFEYRTIDELADYFVRAHADKLQGQHTVATVTQATSSPVPATSPMQRRGGRRDRQRFLAAPAQSSVKNEPIAIVGLSGRYPASKDLEAFWRNLRDGKDCITEIPKQRWDWQQFYSQDRTRPGAHYSKWGGFIEGVDEFDPRFFNIAPREAPTIDPQERMFLQHVWMALEDAGYTRARLQVPNEGGLAGQVGVYAGVMYGEYNVSGTLASIANRVSYFLNLHGPSLTLDTMCSSSLTAIHLACQDLRSGRTSLGIAGGVNVTIHPNKYTMLSAGQFISGDGHCQSFGEGGDGYIPGEGVGVAVLKRLADAERDGDPIHGVIRGSALNHGGKTNGYTVPNPQAQAEVIRRAMIEAGVNPSHMSYIEAHGTGTKLGDPIEIAALSRAFDDGCARESGACLIGSAKSNIGHCESAAGIAGVTKVLLQMKHEVIAPSLHSAKLNPHIDFKATPFVVNQSLRPWEQPVVAGKRVPRIAGISSFGAGGSNAHVVIEEYRAPEVPVTAVREQLIVPVSARTAEQLQQRVRDLLAYIQRCEDAVDLRAMAWTLQVGREAMDDRAAFLAISVDDLVTKLQSFLKGDGAGGAILSAHVKQHKEALSQLTEDPSFQGKLDRWVETKELPALAQLWVKGLDLDWRKLFDDGRVPRLMSLPTYPFASERYWLEPSTVVAAPVSPVAKLHPLVHANTSDLSQQRYTSSFTGKEAFFEGSTTMSPRLLVEMMRAAVELAASPRSASGQWELRDTEWGEPLENSSERNVGIALFSRGDDAIDVEIYTDDHIHCQSHAVYGCMPAPTVAAPEPVVEVSPGQVRALVVGPREILLAPMSKRESAPEFVSISHKPTGIRLLPSAKASSGPVPAKAKAVLSALSVQPSSPATSQDTFRAVRLFGLREGVYAIEIHSTFDAAIEPLLQALNRLRGETSLKALLLIGRHADSWRGDRNAGNTAVERRLFTAVAVLPCPVIAAVPGDAVGAGFLLASACDFLVCSEDGQYGFTDTAAGIFPNTAEERFFRERLGDVVADDLLYRATRYRGRLLHAKGLACRVVSPAQVEDDATRLAAELSRKSQLALSLLKTHLNRHLAARIDDLIAVEVPPGATSAKNAGETSLMFTFGADRQVNDLQAMIAELKLVLERAEESSEYKSVVLRSELDGFLSEANVVSATAAIAELKQLVQRCPLPVIAAFESNAGGLAWLFGLFCDAVVYRNDSRYSASPLWTAPSLAREVTALCAQRFGASLGQEVCLTEGSYSGEELKARVGALVVVDRDEVMSEARRLAAFWDAWPRATILAWKQTQRADWQHKLASLPDLHISENESVAATAVSAPTTIALRSNVVTVTAYPEGVVTIAMREQGAKNMFSDALVSGLNEAFAHVAATPDYKVVVLTGYGNYFATGGTMETLVAIQQGQLRFTDEKVFQLPMDCPLPVIAAVQGHGIGGGWSFGMYSDLILLSEESRYLSPYMGYGFTPGAGSTLMFPEKIGYDLARETLLMAQEISGHELQRRGVPLPVLGRAEVVSSAIELAKRMARHSRERLIGLKRLWIHPLRASCEGVYRREVEMHELTFVSNRQTLETIQSKFAPEIERASFVAATPAQAELPTSSIVGKLKAMLAQEMLLAPEEIDEDTQFIDLGLDSITGVTWIRKINEHYGTDIEATKAYSHPTLKQFAGLVASEAEIAVAAATPAVVPSSREVEGLDGVMANLKAMLAKELLLRPEEIDETAPFIELGLDSITGVTWVRKINERYGTDIEATKVYGHPTLLEMSRLVMQESKISTAPVEPMPTPAVQSPTRSAPAVRRVLTSWRRQAPTNARPTSALETSRATQPIAVIGVAGQFPKANDLEAFWTRLVEGANCITEVSSTRWRLRDYFQEGAATPGKTNSKWLGALDEYDVFDPLFFNISPTEAECMEPQQRLFLQACWHSIENAGYNPHSLAGSSCGVFVGCAPSDYHQASRIQQLSAQGFTGAANSILSARISYFLNLRGPCMAIDTACSSSLVAIANACDSLNGGNSDLALAGGVYVMAGPNMHVMTAQAGMLSTDGRCFTFDQRANGFVPGEAVGALLLKRLADAERDGDRIQAVIEGWGVNQDGKTNGITAPNEESQTRLIQSVYRKFNIDPAGIQFIEAHGTGTKLGDPIEVAGLKAAFKPFTDRSGYCALGSVKSNIGHCLTAAGVAGFVKLMLAMKHRSLPPTINFEQRNEHIKLEGSPFYVNDEARPWEVSNGERRRAAISSFGFSGTNAHLVIAEHVTRERARQDISVVTQGGKFIVPLSAKTTAQLRQKAQDLLAYLRARGQSLDLVDVAYTLQIGREPMDERLGLLVDSLQSLTAKLEAYLAGDHEDLHQGHIKRHKEEIKLISQDDELRAMLVEKWLGQRKLSKLLELWVKGLDLDWSSLYGAAKPRRIELPGYPFAKERFWIDGGAQRRPTGVAADPLHPLVHQNASLLSKQRYRSIFSGEEFFFDATIDGAKFLSSPALLEMSRAAVVHATSDLDLPATVELADIRWEKPLLVEGTAEVLIDLFANDDDGVCFEIAAGGTVHARGVARLVEPMPPARVEIGVLKQSSAERFDAASFYADLKRAGLDYGTTLQGLKSVYQDHDHVLAHICVPGIVDTDGKDYALHPSLLEAVMQACMVFVGDANTRSAQLMLPVSVDSLTLLSACEREMYAWVRHADRADDSRKVDVDLLDAQGECRVAIRGLTLGPATASAVSSQPETVMMVPRWDVVTEFDAATGPVASERIAVIGANDQQRSVLQRHYRESTIDFIGIDASDAVADIRAKLDGIELDKLIWIASASQVESLTEESIIEDQNRGILQVLRIIRASMELGYDKRALAWDVITINSLPVRASDDVNPTHAGLQGITGSMAEVCPRWKIRLFDLPALNETALAGMGRVPWRATKTCYALRGDEWLSQKLLRVNELAPGPLPYRVQGVYVVIGGAGGIGEIWTRHVIEHCQANVIWIGRRELNAEIRQKMQALCVLGKTPEYIQADASNRAELEAAYQRIKRKYPAIHGVVHSAVGAFDQSLKTVSEEDFRSILAVKIDLSVRIAQVFANEALDLVLFFSSNASFASGAGMSGYSSGCAFKDAFALQLAKRWNSVVKVINWGYWSVGAGVALTDTMKTYFHELGYRSLEPREAMAALDRFIASGFDQLSMSQAMHPKAEHLDVGDEFLTVHTDEAGAPLQLTSMSFASTFEHIEHKAGQEMDVLLARLVRSILSSTPKVLRHYDRWLIESQKIVATYEAGSGAAPEQTPDSLWAEWDRSMQVWLRDGGKQALCVLVDKCVRALPGVLTGAQKATDLIFPNSSLELVEKVYKTDAVSLAFNESLRDTLIAAVQARMEAAPAAQIRLLEIGAGTGGTTVGILDKLAPHQSRIAEYCYTDLSRAFLLHAENIYAPRAPYLRTRLFNVEQPIGGQGIEAGRYDFAVAANVIHATRNIRNTLRNAKAVLRKNGMLMLNEVSDKSICGHLTFGLLDGWWLNEDDELRIPGSPGLYPEVWQRVLEEEGFHSVQFPCSEFHAMGQQIVVAFSDGIVRQRRVVAVPSQSRAVQPVVARSQSAKVVSTPAPKVVRDRVDTAELLSQRTVQLCKQLIGKTLKISPSQIDADEPLERYGIDSIIVGLINQELKKHFDDVRATVLYEFQTVQALSAHLIKTQRPALERLFELDQHAAPISMSTHEPIVSHRPVAARSLQARSRRTSSANRTTSPERTPIAIVGISGLYPGAADIEAFWENLKAGKNTVGTIPEKRWSLDRFYEPDVQKAVEQGKSYCKWGGFIDQFAQFDTLFFGIPPKEAHNMDPQERLFMQAAWNALECSGYSRSALRHKYQRKVGVFAGITRAGYNLYRTSAQADDEFRPRTSFSSVANRLSYFLDINGPSLPVDTMCSSSLTAIHEACEHIHNGDCDLAFAGGVNLYLHPTSFVDMSAQRMLSKHGRCMSFGAGCDGFVPGEGVGVVLLKSLDRAVADNDIIHGVILATHVNHGGKTNGFTVPNPVAQAELIRAAIDKANISARDISYIEAHGTGTELGDPIEITGLQQAFAKDSQDRGYCRIGSAKSNIGHLEAAAGIAGLTKVLLQFKHRQIVPSLHASTLNPHIDFDSTPFEVNRALVDWEQPVVNGATRPRIAGISSFGAGGANAHVILQEYVPANARAVNATSGSIDRFIVPLSAKTAEQLEQRASDLFDFLRLPDRRVDLASLAYTLQTGREPMEKRVGFEVTSIEQLTTRLGEYVCGEREIDGVYRGEVKRNNDRFGAAQEDLSALVDQWVARKEYSKLLELWVEGFELDWNRLYSDARPPRVSLPTYPFAKDEYWLDSAMSHRSGNDMSSKRASADAGRSNIIEDIINRIDDDAIDAADGVRLLKQLSL